MGNDVLDTFLDGYEAALIASGNPEKEDVMGMIGCAEMGMDIPIPATLLPVYDFIRDRLAEGGHVKEWLRDRLDQARYGVSLKGRVGGLLDVFSELSAVTVVDFAGLSLSEQYQKETKEILLFEVNHKLKKEHEMDLATDMNVVSIEATLVETVKEHYNFYVVITFTDRDPIVMSPLLVPISVYIPLR
jgi:hypothetical protein